LLIPLLDSCIGGIYDTKVLINNNLLPIRQADPSIDKEEDSFGGYFIIIKEEEFIDKIVNNIKDEIKLDVIIKDYNSFYVTSGL
jgi:predicted esterase YcpF (UPF0227 family)